MNHILVVGSINMDLIVPSARFPAPGETVLGGDLQIVSGGKGANQACAAAKLGAFTRLVACVGDDLFGRRSMQSLQEAGVDTTLVGVSERFTGTALITVRPDGENSIVLSPGANSSLDARTALAALPSLRGGDIVLLQLEIPLETVEAVARHAHDCGATVILDPAPIQPLPPSLLACVDYLTPNQTEAAALLGLEETALTDLAALEEVAAALLAMGCRAVILKLGAQGCFLSGPKGSAYIAAFPVTGVDTTAAGDVFNGAFAVALSEGATPQDAARFGNAASAISVTRMGAQSSVPNRAQTDTFLASRTSAKVDSTHFERGLIVRDH